MDPQLMKGEDWIRCAICGTIHHPPYPNLAVDRHGQKWDICKGDCASEAGLEPPENHPLERRKPPDWARNQSGGLSLPTGLVSPRWQAASPR
jgi:hypothetical protein